MFSFDSRFPWLGAARRAALRQCWSFSFPFGGGPGRRRCFLALHNGARATGQDHEPFGITVEALGQPPIGERGTADLAGTLGAGIDEGPAALAFEVRNAVLVDAQKYRAVEHEPEHQTLAE